MEEVGWTKRWRAMWTKGYHRDHLLWVMMSYFIDFAEYQDTKIFWPAAGKRIRVERGQHLFSVRELSKFLGAGHQQIRTRLDVMKDIEFSTHQPTHRYTILTVLNYSKYQDVPEHKKHSDQHSGNTAVTQPPYYKEGKEEKNNTPLPPKGGNAVAEIEILKTRYPHPEIIESGLSAIASTRKANKVAYSVILTTLQLWDKEPVEKVEGGIGEFISRNYAADGKSERYLLAMIKNHRPKAPGQTPGFVPIAVAPPEFKG